MDSFKKTLIVLALSAVIGLVASMPTDFKADQMDLGTVINQTVCPIEVHYDIDMKRIPQRIKELKCGNEPQQWCKQLGVPEAECCHRRRGDAWMSCAEVVDTVEVYYPDKDVTQPYSVAVGCACVIEQVANVGDLTPADFQK